MIGIIYKIKCYTTQDFYIGSTFNINHRITQHQDKKNRCRSRHIIKRNNYKFEILHTVLTDNEISLKLYENLYILVGWKTNKCINCKIAYNIFNNKEYRKLYTLKNKDKIKKYYQQNREHINQRRRENYKINREEYYRQEMKQLKIRYEIKKCLNDIIKNIESH